MADKSPIVINTSGKKEELQSGDRLLTGDTNVRILAQSSSPIDMTATGTTTLGTVPTGKTWLITEIIFYLDAITGGTGNNKFPKVQVGVGSPYDNLYENTRLSGLDAIVEGFHFNTFGIKRIPASTESLTVDVNTASNATTYDVDYIVLGIEI